MLWRYLKQTLLYKQLYFHFNYLFDAYSQVENMSSVSGFLVAVN